MKGAVIIMPLQSRHPKIHYWFWTEKTITDKTYYKDIDTLVKNSSFDLIFLTQRGGLNFWDHAKFKPLFADMVAYAHTKGLKIGLQLWPQGSADTPGNPNLAVQDCTALVTEYEVSMSQTIHAHGKNARHLHMAPPLKSELLYAAAFKKTGDGFYEEGSLIDLTSQAQVCPQEDLEALDITFDRPDLAGYTIYAMVAHYYQYSDLFGDAARQEFTDIIDAYSHIPFDGFGLDEYKNLNVQHPNHVKCFRERFYGQAFAGYYQEKTGRSLIQTLFEMRWCPQDQDHIRIAAINNYFDIFRHSTLNMENFIAQYAQQTFGPEIFIGLHNTYHNALQNDEIWQTCCNWWELPRKYGQTDEDIAYPVRMGIACGYPESIIYDMFYHPDPNALFEKAVRDARYNVRIHYHAINDGSQWGIDTGKKEFLQQIEKIESKITLLNIFDTVLPKMELLVVFGFPALCNWYPDADARNTFDVNGKLNILDRVQDLWDAGFYNALAPSEALGDGRITIKDGKFDYCGHIFDKLLYLYPEYSKSYVNDFLRQAEEAGCEFKVIGTQSHDFYGQPAVLPICEDHFIDEKTNIAQVMDLTPNRIYNGCILEDGSIVISDFDSVMDDTFTTYPIELGGHHFEARFRGTLALKVDDEGNIVKFVAGNLKYLKMDDEIILEGDGTEDCVIV